MTGDVLFRSDDLYRLCADVDELIPKERYQALDNNVYLIDFLNFMLVKDPRLRPSISAVIKRFEHVHALLVVTGPTHFNYASNKKYMTESSLIECLKESVNLLELGHDKRISLKIQSKYPEGALQISANSIMSINKDISYCSKHYLKVERNLSQLQITHIISMAPRGMSFQSPPFTHYNIDELYHLNQAFDILYLDDLYTPKNTVIFFILNFFRKTEKSTTR